jgi:hypothetical protein
MIFVVIGVMLTFLLCAKFMNNPVKIPRNDTHRPLLELVAQGDSWEGTEKQCLICHGP